MIFSRHLIVVILLVEVFAFALSPASATATVSMPRVRPTAFNTRAPPVVSPSSVVTPFAGGLTCDLNITKTMSPPSPVVSGSTVTFTFTVADGGTAMCGTPGAANPQTTVTDNLPPGLSALPSTVAAPSGWDCSATTTAVVSCTTSTWFPVNQPVAITVQATVTQASGLIENCANVATSMDQNSSNNQSCIHFSVTPSGTPCDLQIAKRISPSPVASGSTATVTLTLQNVGQTMCGVGIITPIRITDNLPAGMTAAGSATASLSGWDCTSQSTSTTIICYTTTGAAAQIQSTPFPPFAAPLMITFPVTVTGTSGSLLTNTATITNNLNNNPYFPDPNQANNQASASVTIGTASTLCSLTISKTATLAPFSAVGVGQGVTFTITVTNTGSASCAAGAPITTTVTDTLPSGFSNLVASGSGWSCTTSGLTVTCGTLSFFGPSVSSTITITATAPTTPGTYQNCAMVSNSLSTPPTSQTTPCPQITIGPATPPPGTGCANTGAAVIDGTGLVAWWPGDGNTNDIVGGYNGVLMGTSTTPNYAPTYAPGWTHPQATSFVSQSGSGGGESLPTGGPSSTTFTIDAWINPFAIGYPANTIYSDNSEHGLWLKQAGNGPGTGFLMWRDSTLTPPVYFIGSTVIQVNSPVNNGWTHIALTYDGTYITGYVNGVIDNGIPGYSSSTPWPGQTSLPTGPGLFIGGHANLFGWTLDARLNDLEIWNRALPQSEIQQIYAAGSAGKCPTNVNYVPEFPSGSSIIAAIGILLTLTIIRPHKTRKTSRRGGMVVGGHGTPRRLSERKNG